MAKALIAMSGGVDSSVAAYCMVRDGYECMGCTMKLYDSEQDAPASDRTCCSLDDVEDARSVAFRLGFPYQVFNFKDEFRDKVIAKFVKSYMCGVTPNPCIDCNRYLKFQKLHERARVLGFDCVVTGHYARIEHDGERYVLKKALDLSKDQSYVLYSMTQEQLRHTRFPLGEMTKDQTRAIAAAQGFINADKPDSQDICFVPDGDYARVIESLTGSLPPAGNFVDLAGNVVGQHRGIIHYTIGQRKGLGLSSTEPWFVTAICPETNQVLLGRAGDLMRTEADVEDFHLISGETLREPIECRVKIRYRQTEQSATVIPTGADTVRIRFASPQRAITPGQAAVLYDGDIVLGGGTIAR